LGKSVISKIESGVFKGKLGRISGMDPAGPNFLDIKDRGCENHLCHSDALFVDVIHTNSAFYGTNVAIGHVDYYPNGGSTQPGCSLFSFKHQCSHSRSHDLFTESISSENLGKFKSLNCDSHDTFKKHLKSNKGIFNYCVNLLKFYKIIFKIKGVLQLPIWAFIRHLIMKFLLVQNSF
jgi:hypothetical protein